MINFFNNKKKIWDSILIGKILRLFIYNLIVYRYIVIDLYDFFYKN